MSATTAKKIRDELKSKLGLTSRQVSVRSPHWGSVDVTIKSADVRISQVEAIANAHENIHRCEASGEILSGANTFVRVEYALDCYRSMRNEILDLIEDKENTGISVMFRGVTIVCPTNQSKHLARWYAEGCGVDIQCYGASHLADQVAIAILDGKGACRAHSDCADHEELGIACAESRQVAA